MMVPSILSALSGGQSAEGPGSGQDQNGSGQKSERRPEKEAVSRHCHPRRPQGEDDFVLVIYFLQPDVVQSDVTSGLESDSIIILLLQILLLDEPTAGMDPSSRHQVWSLLKSRRAGRVIVLCTHYMDEADILAGTDYLLVPPHQCDRVSRCVEDRAKL